MSDIKQYEPLWGSWYVDALVGEGSFGKVYRCRKEEFGRTYYSAVKIISIPQNEADLRQIRGEGMNEASVRSYFQAFVADIIQEIDLMSAFRGNSNIVSFEDHKVIEQTDRLGWDILVRMELLTSLTDHANSKALSQDEVIKLGVHICKALELCALKNTIHRDIKPDNIFVSEYGEYKLGDFGIARQIERTTSGLSKKGTYTYMAPEVFKGEEYGASVDIYSLGIVLYRYLNEGRTPFLPEFPEPITPHDRDESMQRRMRGEPLQPIKGVSAQLNAVVMKACAYDRKARYTSATELREALEAIAGGGSYAPVTTTNRNAVSQDSTVRLFGGGTPYQETVAESAGATERIFTERVEYAAQPGPVRPKQNNTRKLTIAIAAAAAAAVLIVSISLFFILRPAETGGGNDPSKTQTVKGRETETETEESEGSNILDDDGHDVDDVAALKEIIAEQIARGATVSEDVNQGRGVEYFSGDIGTDESGAVVATKESGSEYEWTEGRLTAIRWDESELSGELDLSKLTGLEYFSCISNELSELSVSKNINLETLVCILNDLSELNVSKNVNLKTLDCAFNQLNELDMSKNVNLEFLECTHNQLIALDVSKNVSLEFMFCSYNGLNELDMSKNVNLEFLECTHNQLIALDVSKNVNLKGLLCFGNKLSELDVSNNLSLKGLSCFDNQLRKLDVSKNVNLEILYCADNQLSELDVSKNVNLIELNCTDNQLSELDVSKNVNLETLDCNNDVTLIGWTKSENTGAYYSVGDTLSFGNYNGEPITWRVLDEDVADGAVFVVSEDILELRAYQDNGEDCTWETSDIRRWLNDDFFYSAFTANEREQIEVSSYANNDNPWYGTDGGSETADFVYLLSLDEVVRYFGDSGTLGNGYNDGWLNDEYNSNRIARFKGTFNGEDFTNAAIWWWLRSPGEKNNHAAFVGGDGGVNVAGDIVNVDVNGIRPALWIKLVY